MSIPTAHSEAAMALRQRKFDFAEAFPGRLADLAAAVGKTLVGSVQMEGSATLLAFSDGTFAFADPAPLRGELVKSLLAAREFLAAKHGAAYAELDRLIAAEAEEMRLGRMEKVIGAVRTNLPEIPELREELRRVLDEPER